MSSGTAVLLTAAGAINSRLLYGSVVERRPHPRGTVLVLPPGEIAFYCLHAFKCRTFVFRTLTAPERLANEVPGVSPRVRLLLQTQTLGRLARLEELLRYLAKNGQNPSSLSDLFYSRLHAILSGKLPSSGKILRSLLDQEDPRTQVA